MAIEAEPTAALEAKNGLRILHVVTRSHRRGAEVFALELALASDALGDHNEVVAITRATDGGETAGLPPLVPTNRLGIRAFVQGTWSLHRLLKHNPADVVLAHGGWAAIVVAATGSSTSTVRIWQRILGLPLEQWGRTRLAIWAMIARRFDGVVALTPDMETEMRELGYAGPVWAIGNAREPGRFAAVDRTVAAATLRQQIGISEDLPLLGFVGHLVDQKHPEMAVDVLAEVHRQGQPAHLVMAGDGPRWTAVLARIKAHGLEDSVTLLGHRDDPETIFGGVNLVLITSRAEGIPGVAIEAQMTGCPVLTFRLGAIEDVVEDGVTGVIVPRGDSLAMASAAVELMRDRDRLHAMSLAATPRVSGFTTAITATLYASRYHELRSARRR
jgi:glycosyltransferase involved in cell wall biosynthesis